MSKSTPIPFSKFSSKGLSIGDGFDIWRESVSPLFNPSMVDDSPFFAEVDAFHIESLVFARGHVTPQEFNRDSQLLSKDQADHILLQLYQTGGFVGFNGKQDIQVNPGDICVLDLGQALHTQTVTSESLSIAVPRDVWNAHCKSRVAPNGIVLQGSSTMGNILANHIQSIWAGLPNAQACESSAIQGALLSVAAHCLDDRYERKSETDGCAMKQATITAIQAYIMQHLGSSKLNADILCLDFNCSRSYLYHLFNPYHGVTHYIQQKRLEMCFRELASTKVKSKFIGEIAYRWGFINQSHFTRLFRKVFGVSPKEVRELRLTSEKMPQKSIGSQLNSPSYSRWLQQL